MIMYCLQILQEAKIVAYIFIKFSLPIFFFSEMYILKQF